MKRRKFSDFKDKSLAFASPHVCNDGGGLGPVVRGPEPHFRIEGFSMSPRLGIQELDVAEPGFDALFEFANVSNTYRRAPTKVPE